MPVRDVYHDQVKSALAKDGWRITHDPLSLKWNEQDLFVDLGAEEVLAAEKSGRRIAVEIKSFIGPSQMHDLEQALGQFVLYRIALRKKISGSRTLSGRDGEDIPGAVCRARGKDFG